MDTTVNQISPVEHELVVTASADELAPEVNKALRSQRAQTTTKGFRPGKVPLSLVKRMYGKAIAYTVAEKEVQNVFNEKVIENDEYNVVGQPLLTEMETDVDADLRAVIRFGTRPEVELQPLSDVTVPKLKADVSDDTVEEQIAEFRKSHAELTPTDEPAGETDQVVIDVQEIDRESNTPVVGKRHEDQELFLDEVTEEWKAGLLGKKAGETTRVEISHGDDHAHHYEVDVKEVKSRELPELDDALIAELTEDRFSSMDEFRDALRSEISTRSQDQARELFEGALVTVVLERHPIDVPFSAVDLYLDSFVEDVKNQNKGKLPSDFNEEHFRAANRHEAERQARWMFIRDRIIETNDIEVSDEDLEKHFDEQAADQPFDAATMRQYYDQLGITERIRQQLLSRKVFAHLEAEVTVEEHDADGFNDAMKSFNESYIEKEPTAPTAE
jgi:trigger factor